ncbi:glycosyltransferase family 9 protein [Derxia gummosa]|uniref:Glycosyltransferase family 9 protein n=1 Tax=Derxia gummosa DSM 723 TaxID=1121388 RepID=A0A8B6X2V1_9BURK|nr:glycosyltransferase family 9 protein [Derxia gummosa]
MPLAYFRRLHQPDCLPPIDHELDREHAARPRRLRINLARRLVLRDLGEILSGRFGRRCMRIGPEVRRVLWVYGWTTIGDSVMDLAARDCFPPRIEVSLCISPRLAGLYSHDPRFARVFTDRDRCGDDYDLILVQDFNTATFKWLRRRYPRLPYAGIIGDLRGERLDRPGFTQGRIRALFNHPGRKHAPRLAPPPRPPALPPSDGPRTEVAVALGANDPRRRVNDWGRLLPLLAERWPTRLPPPRFHLLGIGNAREDADQLDPAWRATHCVDHVDALDLETTSALIHRCAAFVGPDGGLMHVAVGHGKPGCAVFFPPIRPEWRLVTPAALAVVEIHASQGPATTEAIADSFISNLMRKLL